ncbi:unnamed protein product [Choristocarpus tenellus]
MDISRTVAAVAVATCLVTEPAAAFGFMGAHPSTRLSQRVATPSMVAAAPSALTTTKSEEYFAEAKTIMPGGVSSPVRAFKSVGGNPVVFDRVKGAYAWDVDGNKYIDYVGTWGPAIVGHADDEVLDSLKATLEKGTSFGAPSVHENTLAKMVIDAVPSVEMVRFTNSGTEVGVSGYMC